MPPLNGCLCLPILVYSNTVFGTSRNDKTTDNDRKRINYVKHSSPLTFILCEIAGNQLLYINLTQKPVLLTRLYGCVGKRDASLQNRYRYFVSNYDMNQYVKTLFSKISCFDF